MFFLYKGRRSLSGSPQGVLLSSIFRNYLSKENSYVIKFADEKKLSGIFKCKVD